MRTNLLIGYLDFFTMKSLSISVTFPHLQGLDLSLNVVYGQMC